MFYQENDMELAQLFYGENRGNINRTRVRYCASFNITINFYVVISEYYNHQLHNEPGLQLRPPDRIITLPIGIRREIYPKKSIYRSFHTLQTL